MLGNLFYKHAHFCASRPWEVILSTLTLSACLASVGIFTTPDKVCGWNYECEQHQVVFFFSNKRRIRPSLTKFLIWNDNLSSLNMLSNQIFFKQISTQLPSPPPQKKRVNPKTCNNSIFYKNINGTFL